MDQETRYLLHGTSMRAFVQIMMDDTLRQSEPGTCHVSLTRDAAAAHRFATMQAEMDDRPIYDDRDLGLAAQVAEIEAARASGLRRPEGVVLMLDRAAMIEAGYALEALSDPVWGGGQCDDEREEAVLEDVTGLHRFIVAIGVDREVFCGFCLRLPKGPFQTDAIDAAEVLRRTPNLPKALRDVGEKVIADFPDVQLRAPAQAYIARRKEAAQP